MKPRLDLCLILFSSCLLASAASARVVPNPLFADHAVLQQAMAVPVWGTADPGEQVTVSIAGQEVVTTAGTDGRWQVQLAPLTAGGPYDMTIAGSAGATVLHDILVGEVWICSGQSNMERHLGLQPGQKPIINWEHEVAAATHLQIRQFYVPQTMSFAPQDTVNGSWTVCSPETVENFTAVGYFFGRDLQAARGVPVGLIHSSWGGTPAEAWTSRAALEKLGGFDASLEQVKGLAENAPGARQLYETRLAEWFAAHDPASPGANGQKLGWAAPDTDTSGWATMKVPGLWEDAGLPDFDGVVWFQRTFDVPAAWVNHDLRLRLCAIDDVDTTWINGVRVGQTSFYSTPRTYIVPASAIRAGRNVITVRVLDTGGGGGLWGSGQPTDIMPADGTGTSKAVSLTGVWRFQPTMKLADAPAPPMNVTSNANAPTVLYNGMIAPLLPYAMRGVIWYQGEANVGRELQYRSLFPAMIADWRRRWGEGNFPFLFVQIAPFRGMTPEIREAQLLTLQHTPNTAMAVTIDVGDADDIHPANKVPVGARLALAARALAYGEDVEYSGPIYRDLRIDGAKAVLTFAHVAGGMVAPGGELRGFSIAGADGAFHPAEAVIAGDTVEVSSPDVAKPVAVRYAWANVPDGNLFNTAGLPASPFRTDVK